jgi:hypothetical protein
VVAGFAQRYAVQVRHLVRAYDDGVREHCGNGAGLGQSQAFGQGAGLLTG